MCTFFFRSIALLLCWAPLAGAQSPDDTELKQVIIFGRHGVRSALEPNSVLNTYSAQPYPQFSVPPGNLTGNGATLETILGGYYRLWLIQEGLLTGTDSLDAPFTYSRANNLERTRATAAAFGIGLLPLAGVNVNYSQQESDPLFNPVGAGTARLDPQMAVAAISGRVGNDAQSLASADSADLALARSVLFSYPLDQNPSPPTPAGKIDVTAIPFSVSMGPSDSINLGGLSTAENAIEPFVFEYAEGMPASEVGWGQMTAAGISQISRLTTLVLDLEYRTPYIARVLSSNVASHIVRSMVQAATGNAMTGSLASPSTKVILLIASDVNVTALAALFHLDWVLPGYQADYCGPGGALVFQLRQSQSTGEFIVRASYLAQTLDQLRNQSPLTLAAPPASAPVFIPGCSTSNATFDCPLAAFVSLADRVIDPNAADTTN
jgi:4-phytase / acid phosphatase